MNTIKLNEQWKLDGYCVVCKRKSYCSEKCTKNKNNYFSEKVLDIWHRARSSAEGKK